MLSFGMYLTKFNFVLIIVLTTSKVSFEQVMTNNYSHKNKKKQKSLIEVYLVVCVNFVPNFNL